VRVYLHGIADAIFDNLRGARARLRKGIAVSDAIKRSLENTKANQKTSAWLEARTDANPLWSAEHRYARAHSVEHFKQLVEPLFEQPFPASHQSSSKSP